MTRLTEDMVVARTRVSELGSIKKFNCWGSELSDVTLLRMMKNAEVLSLSVNNITTLADIQNCYQLKELFIRKNKIKELNEICYLKDLSKLWNLWLEENPCAEVDQYRMTVIKNLPQLKKLDNVPIKPEETQEAIRLGVELLHPLEKKELEREAEAHYSQHPPSPERRSLCTSSPGSQNLYHEDGYGRRLSQTIYKNPHEVERARHTYIQQCPTRRRSQDAEQLRQANMFEQDGECYDNDRRNANFYMREEAETSHPNFRHSGSFHLPYESSGDHMVPYREQQIQGGQIDHPSSHYSRDNDDQSLEYTNLDTSTAAPVQLPVVGPAPVANSSQMQECVPTEDLHSPVRSLTTDHLLLDESEGGCHSDHRSPGTDGENGRYSLRSSISDVPHLGQVMESNESQHMALQHFEKTFGQVQQQMDTANRMQPMERTSPTRPYPLRPKTRNSNILSAILCLIKELDYPSLEVVEMAVRCRMEELED